MLTISLETICYIIIKAREFDVKVDPVEPDPGSNPSDTEYRQIISDYAGDPVDADYEADPTEQELRSVLEAVNQDETMELLALVWVGRGDYSREQWEDALSLARDRLGDRPVAYLMGIPLLGDYLEDALSQFDISCEDIKINRL